VEKRAVMLAAVETVAKADPVRASRRHDPHVATQAAAGEPVHACVSSKIHAGGNLYTIAAGGLGRQVLGYRLQLKIARELYAVGQSKAADAIRADLAHDLAGTKAAEFAAYWPAFVEASAR
jgi:hypothetical protein